MGWYENLGLCTQAEANIDAEAFSFANLPT